MLCLLLRHQYLRNQVAFLTIEYCRRQRRRARRHSPYFWKLPRPNQSWFEIHYNDRRILGDYFRKQLRMKKCTFDILLNVLRPAVTRENTRLRDCIAPEKVLALGLDRLAHGNSYESIGPVFNIGRLTVPEAVQDVVEALFNLRNDYIKFPTTEAETRQCIATFEDVSDLPNIVGAIHGSHIKIAAPLDSAVDYLSRYQHHEFIVQAIVDGRKRFLDFASGFPGSMHDARVLRNSTTFDLAEHDRILTGPSVQIGGNDIQPYLVGDSTYPLASWLQKPFPEATRDPEEITFNKSLPVARVAVEYAFGMLKNRWRILRKRLDSKISFANKIAVACAVRPNFCLLNQDEWNNDENDDP